MICDEAGGCGSEKPVFPWSMSDFKPGDYNETERITAASLGCLAIGLLCAFKMTPLTASV